jgi:phage terminase large subunit-like protein
MTVIRSTDVQSALKHQKRTAEEIARLRDGLPHLYGQKWYSWAKAYFESRNQMNLLCAANQISKSSTQLRKMIHWATAPKLWPGLWPKSPRPSQFWLLYPSRDVATAEWETKIVPEFMPRNEFKHHPVYGWNDVYDKKQLTEIHFNSGVTIYVRSYSQDVHNLQSGSVHAIFADEEMPEELYSELMFRLAATDGHFHMVFTATRGQLMWLRAIEGEGDDELFPNAFKQQISMFDCQTYMDGTPGRFTLQKIKEIISSCQNQTEVLRRVYGKFVRESGRIYHEYDPLTAWMKPQPIPGNWSVYSALDHGTGGTTGHPAAYCFIAIRPDNRMGWVFKGWRGDGVETAAGDVVNRWDVDREGRTPVVTSYDWSAKDLATIAGRLGFAFKKAEKSHDTGEHIVNTLFKHGMLKIFDIPELRKLGSEFLTVMHETPKRKRKDDLSDTVRYAVCDVPWDWTAIQGKESDEETAKKEEGKVWTDAEQAREDERSRRGKAGFRPQAQDEENWGTALDAEIAEWNEFYGS